MTACRFQFFGPPHFETSAGETIAIRSRKGVGLLACLALAQGKPVSRDRLCALLWSDRQTPQARASLRQLLSDLRRDFGQAGDVFEIASDGAISCNELAVQCDIADFDRFRQTDDRMTLERISALRRGQFIEGLSPEDPVFADWIEDNRRSLDAQWCEAAARLLRVLEREGDHRRGLEIAGQVLSVDPLCELAHQSVIRAHLATNNRSLALRHYQEFREKLDRDLGVEPDALTQKIIRDASAPQPVSAASVTTPAPVVSARKPKAPIAVLPFELISQSADDLHVADVRVYRTGGTTGAVATADMDDGERPTIALLPFANMSGDRAQDYIGDGLTESIITGLSRFSDLNVIASNSSFVYKGKAIKVQDASRELNARYILEGSVQKAGERVRITAQLIDGKTGRHIWAERYDRGIDDLFAVQDEVTGLIVGTLATSHGGRLRKAWQERGQVSGTGNMLAMDYFLRGMDFLNRFTKEDNKRAVGAFTKSAVLDPSYAKPIAKIAWAHYIDANLGWTASGQDSLAQGLEYAKAAIALDDDESWGHYALAGYHVYTGRFDLAINAYERALSLNPNDADILMDFAMCLCIAGRKKEALERAQRAMSLNPHCPEWYLAQMGEIYFEARLYAEAIAAFERLLNMETVHTRLIEAASHAALGHAELARRAVERALQLDPQSNVQDCTSPERAPYNDPKDREHFRENLRKAGLPE